VRIGYPANAQSCADALERLPIARVGTLDDALDADARARAHVRSRLRLDPPRPIRTMTQPGA